MDDPRGGSIVSDAAGLPAGRGRCDSDLPAPSRNRLDEYNARRRLEWGRSTRRKQRPDRAIREVLYSHPCRVCQSQQNIEIHHLVPRSKFGRRDETVNDPANLIPLCHHCHQDHHTTDNRVPRGVLTLAEVTFIRSRQSEGWLERWYPA